MLHYSVESRVGSRVLSVPLGTEVHSVVVNVLYKCVVMSVVNVLAILRSQLMISMSFAFYFMSCLGCNDREPP